MTLERITVELANKLCTPRIVLSELLYGESTADAVAIADALNALDETLPLLEQLRDIVRADLADTG